MADLTENDDIQPDRPFDESADQLDRVVRQWLAELPRPVMPYEVRARLDEAIAAEAITGQAPAVQAQGVETLAVETHALQAAAAMVPQQTPRTVGLPAPRRRRSIGMSLIGVAAAFVMFAAVDPFATAPPPADDLLADQSAQPESTNSAGGIEPGTEALAPPSSQVEAVTVASGLHYTALGLAAEVQSVLAKPLPRAPVELAAVEACIAGLGPPSTIILVDQAEFEGQPALIVAQRTADGKLTITVHGTTCTADDSATLAIATVAPPTPTP